MPFSFLSFLFLAFPFDPPPSFPSPSPFQSHRRLHLRPPQGLRVPRQRTSPRGNSWLPASPSSSPPSSSLFPPSFSTSQLTEASSFPSCLSFPSYPSCSSCSSSSFSSLSLPFSWPPCHPQAPQPLPSCRPRPRPLPRPLPDQPIFPLSFSCPSCPSCLSCPPLRSY